MPKSPTQDWERLRTAALQARLPFERDAWLNLAFYLNEQYVEWNKAKAIAAIPRDPKPQAQPRPIVNKIMHFVQQEHASALQDKPPVDVMPATDDQKDISTAEVAKALLDMQMLPTVANFDRKRRRAVLWAIICAEGYLKWVWDSAKNQPAIVPCSAFEGYPTPTRATSKGAVRHPLQVHGPRAGLRHLGGRRRQAGRSRPPTRCGPSCSRGMGSRRSSTASRSTSSGTSRRAATPRACTPRGRGQQFLVPPGPLPYDHKMLPFTQHRRASSGPTPHYFSPGHLPALGPDGVQPVPRAADHVRENFANGKWWIPNELQMEQMPNDSRNQILRGDGGMTGLAPQILSPPPWPADDDGAMIEQQMMNVFGLHEVSQAQVPGRVEAAKAIETLKEADADRTATLRQTMQDSAAIGGYMTLRLAQQFAPDEVLVMAYSREGLQEVKQFRAADLKPGFGVNTSWTTGLARSRTAKQDLLMRMWDSQAITDPSRLADLLEVPTPTLLSSDALDVRLAKNENIVMAQNQAVVPNSWDNHAIHIQEHNDYRKTHEFRLPVAAQADPCRPAGPLSFTPRPVRPPRSSTISASVLRRTWSSLPRLCRRQVQTPRRSRP
jgi:hypothetical protein